MGNDGIERSALRMTLDDRLSAYKRDGYTIFEGVFGEALIQSWKDVYPNIVDRQTPFGESEPTTWLRSTLEYEPKLFLPAVAHPLLLDFAELVMGPFVQMDNLTFMAFPSVSEEEARNKASGWHRDIWAFKPTHTEYVPPLAANAITYLQDMTEEYGPLRVIPGSHRSNMTIAEEENQTSLTVVPGCEISVVGPVTRLSFSLLCEATGLRAEFAPGTL